MPRGVAGKTDVVRFAIPVDSLKLASALNRARAYLLERQSPSGGFCFYRGYYAEEPNLSDTWHAIAVLIGLLGVDLPEKNSHASFVIGQPIAPQPLLLYYRVRTLLALGADDPRVGRSAIGRGSARHISRTLPHMPLSPPHCSESDVPCG
ncbi:hypothetical protein [Rhodanobacter lindaniclasticus]